MRKLKYVKLFESFQERKHRYKLTGKTEYDIMQGLKWFSGGVPKATISNYDLPFGFVSAVSLAPFLLDELQFTDKLDNSVAINNVIRDHTSQFLKKSEGGGYEIEIGIFNDDGKFLSGPVSGAMTNYEKHVYPPDVKWDLQHINEIMKSDIGHFVNCEIVELNEK